MTIRKNLRFFAWIALVVFLPVVAWAQISITDLSHEWSVEPGQIYHGEIDVANASGASIVLEISHNDYVFYCDGQTQYGPPGKLARSNADWISFGLSSGVTVLGNSSITIPYTITVPDNPDLVGTYWSILIVGSSPVAAASSGGVGIRQVFGYGIQIVTNIGDTGSREINIIGSHLSETDDGLLFQVDIENTGERWVRPVVSLEVYNEEGDFVDRFESQSGRRRVYPGTSVRHRISLPGLEPGKYPAMLYIDNLDEHVWAAQVTIEVQ